MSDFVTTPVLGLFKPAYDADDDQWGNHLNANFDVLDRVGSARIGEDASQNQFAPLWWDTNSGQLFIQYDDGNSVQWVPANSTTDPGSVGIANAIDFGADPTGSEDSAPAINQALATGKPTRLPKGNYLVRSALNVGSGCCLYGDGRGITNILVDQTFSPTDLGVIVLTGVEDQAPIVSDLRVTFQQPADQASRSNFLTLAQGGTSVPGGTGIKYPPAFYSSASGRWKLARLRVDSAWDGIYSSTGQPGFITEIEMGAFNRGLVVGESRDFVHISAFHFWNFGFNSSQSIFNVFTDGNTFAARFGEFGGAEGVEVTDFTTFVGRIYIENSLSWLTFNGLMCDQGATVEINGCDWVLINNMYYTGPPQGSNTNSPITQYGAFGQVQITNLYGLNTHTPFVAHSAGILHISGSLFGSNGFPNIPAILSSAGQLFLDTSIVYVNDVAFGAWTGPIIDVTGGILSMRGCSFQQSVSGAQPGLVITTDSANHYVGNNDFNGWPFTAPGTLGFYSYNSDGNVQGPVHISGGNLFVPTVTASAAVVVSGAAGTQRNIVYETAGSERWVVAANNAPETGGNAGSDFIIGAVADDGISSPAVQFPFQITRATGAVLLHGLPALHAYANDAAAAAGGVVVGQLYRNGSVVQVRVS